MVTNRSSKRSATTLRCGNIKATICENTSEKGTVLRNDLLSPVQGSVRHVAQWHLIRSQ